MEYLLSETEYNKMMPRAKHNKECSKYRKIIKALQTNISILESQYKVISGESSNEKDPLEELPTLLNYLTNNAKKIILSLVEKQGGEINNLYFGVIYNNDDNSTDYSEDILTSIHSNGKLTIENKKDTHLDKLTPDSLYILACNLYDDCKK